MQADWLEAEWREREAVNIFPSGEKTSFIAMIMVVLTPLWLAV